MDSIDMGHVVGRAFRDVLGAVRAAVRAEGMEVLTEVDVAAVLRRRLGAHVPPQVVLGVWDVELAHRGLLLEPDLGLLLPWSVVVRQLGPDRVQVAAPNPVVAVLGTTREGDLLPIARQAAAVMRDALAAVVSRPSGR